MLERVAVAGLRDVRLFGDVVVDELITMPRHRADETGIFGRVAETFSKDPDRLCHRPVGDDDVVPNLVEDLFAVHGLVAPLDKKHEQIEVARDERDLRVAAQ